MKLCNLLVLVKTTSPGEEELKIIENRSCWNTIFIHVVGEPDRADYDAGI